MIKTPVCLFLYQRINGVKAIMDVLAVVQPTKLYLLSDFSDNEEVMARVTEVREYVKSHINWECETICDFANEHRGVFKNIGLGAMRIFEKEEQCIFIEDDNVPDSSFFQYCEELLNRYKNDDKVFMICGTNYDEKVKSDCSYNFVKALLPCGWASWGHKFNKYYDTTLEKFDDKNYQKVFLSKYTNKTLGKQQLKDILNERNRLLSQRDFISWDYHLIATIMANDFLVAYPKNNLIKNVGVDAYSEHTKHKKKMDVMTKRFCLIDTHSLEFPLSHPNKVEINPLFQRKCDAKIVYPLSLRTKIALVKMLRGKKEC